MNSRRALLHSFALSGVLLSACGERTTIKPTPTPVSPLVTLPEPKAIAQDITPGKKGGLLAIAVMGGPKTFNPTVANEESSKEVYRLLFSKIGLYDWKNQKTVPGLAHKWSVADDNRTWTFHLRKNLKWSDGEPLTADDVVFTWNDVIYNPGIDSVTADIFKIEGKQFEVTKIDELTFRVVTPKIFAPFIEFFGDVEILPKHVLAEAVKAKRFKESYGINIDPKDFVGSGPYKLKEFKPGEYTLLERNPHYHRFDNEGTRLPYIDNVVVTEVPDMNALALKFENGESHVMRMIRSEDYERLNAAAEEGKFQMFDLGVGPEKRFFWFNMNTNKTAALKIVSTPPEIEVMWGRIGLGKTPVDKTLPVGDVQLIAAFEGKRQTNTIQLNESTVLPLQLKVDFGTIQIADPRGDKKLKPEPIVKPERLKWFLNKKFRQAISYAIDRPSIVESIYAGRADFNYSYISPANKQWYNPNVPKFPYDPDKARALLAEIEIKDRDNDGYLEDGDGNDIEFIFNTNTGNTERERIAVLVQDDLKRLGVRLVYQPLEFNTLVQKVTGDYKYDCVLLGLGGASLDPQSSANVLVSSGFTHFWFPRQLKPVTEWEARIDELYARQVETLEFDERKKMIDEVQMILGDQIPFIYLVQKYNYAAIKNGVGNVKPTAMYSWHVTWNLDELYYE